jgi:hypothetical protein
MESCYSDANQIGYGSDESPVFWLHLNADRGSGAHVAFAAPDRPPLRVSTRQAWRAAVRTMAHAAPGSITVPITLRRSCSTPTGTTSRPSGTERKVDGVDLLGGVRRGLRGRGLGHLATYRTGASPLVIPVSRSEGAPALICLEKDLEAPSRYGDQSQQRCGESARILHIINGSGHCFDPYLPFPLECAGAGAADFPTVAPHGDPVRQPYRELREPNENLLLRRRKNRLVENWTTDNKSPEILRAMPGPFKAK